jgi:hypothetical protein
VIDLRFVPLTRWPGERTQDQQEARFRAGYVDTLRKLEYELDKLKASEIIIRAFFRESQIRNDGWPMGRAEPSESGVILAFKTPAGPLSFPCDRYATFDDNLRAIALSLEALRAVDRYGVTKRAEQYAGWKRIEAPPAAGFNSKEDAARFIYTQDPLSIHPERIINDAGLRTEAYRRAARRLHPDNTQSGNHELFLKLGQALTLLETNP